MKNTKKSLLALLLCLALCLTMLAVACNDNTPEDPNTDPGTADTPEDPNNPGTTDPGNNNDPENQTPAKPTYTVTVKDQDGNPVANVAVQICIGEICLMPNITGEQGTVTFTFNSDPGDATAEVQILGEDSPAGYEYPTGKQSIAAGEKEITLTVTKTAD